MYGWQWLSFRVDGILAHKRPSQDWSCDRARCPKLFQRVLDTPLDGPNIIDPGLDLSIQKPIRVGWCFAGGCAQGILCRWAQLLYLHVFQQGAVCKSYLKHSVLRSADKLCHEPLGPVRFDKDCHFAGVRAHPI